MARDVIRWPGSELPSLRRELDRWLEGFTLEVPFAGHGDWAPAMDITETQDAFSVKAELPGMDPKEIDVQVQTAAAQPGALGARRQFSMRVLKPF